MANDSSLKSVHGEPVAWFVEWLAALLPMIVVRASHHGRWQALE